MTRVARLCAVALMSGAISLSSAAESQACCLWNWFGCGGSRTTYRPLFPRLTNYGACNTCQPACNPCPQTCQYTPVTCYRTQSVCVPVTTCRPVTTCDPCTGCPRTVMRPTTTYVRQTYRVPYTTYRMSAAPASNCCGSASTYYSPASSYTPSSACCDGGANATYPSGTVVQPAPGYPSESTIRPGPVTDQPSLEGGAETTYEETSTRSRVRLQPPIPDLNDGGDEDRTTSMPILRGADRVASESSATVLQAQHVRPVRKKLGDGGWRSARD